VIKILVIKFSVYNQRLRRITSGIIPSNAYGKLKFEFDFRTSDWNAVTTKTANFSYRGDNYPIELDEHNQCFVPKEVINLPSFNVAVHGGDIVTNYVRNPVEEIKSNTGTIPPSDDDCDCGPNIVYVPEVNERKILSSTLQEVTDHMPSVPSTDLNPSDEWLPTSNEVESEYIWEPMQ
jgi:hypothetical protein